MSDNLKNCESCKQDMVNKFINKILTDKNAPIININIDEAIRIRDLVDEIRKEFNIKIDRRCTLCQLYFNNIEPYMKDKQCIGLEKICDRFKSIMEE